MKYFALILFICLIESSFSQSIYPDSQKDGKYIMVNGAKIWVVIFGQGDPIILIPGGPGGAHPIFRPAFDTLSKHNTLIYFDAFGRGKSDTAKNVNEYSLARDIEDLEGIRKALHYEKWNVLGHSYGGIVAQGYALKYPEHVKHLILANTLHSNEMWQKNDDNSNHEIKTQFPEIWSQLMAVRAKGAISRDEQHQEILSQIPGALLFAYNPENLKRRGAPYPNFFNTKIYYQIAGDDADFKIGNDAGKFDYRKELIKLKMPVLIYGGRYDRVAVPEMMIKYKEYCPQAKFYMFEKSGHRPQIEEPEKLFELLNQFLQN